MTIAFHAKHYFVGLFAILLAAPAFFLNDNSLSAQNPTPVILSTMPVVNQRVVTRFNLANFERIRHRYTALSCQFMPDCYDDPCYGSIDEVSTVRGQMGACSPCQPACGPCAPYYGGGSFWFQNYGDFVTQQQRYGNIAGYHADSYGLQIGYDFLQSGTATFGVAVGGAFSEAKAKQTNEKSDTDSFLVALYGGTTGGYWNLLGSLGYVHSAFDTYRQSVADLDERLFSKHHGETMFGSFELSWAAFQQSLCMTPFLAYDFIRMKENGYGERSADGTVIDDALTVNSRRSTSYLQTLGLRFERAYYEGGWLVQPSLSLGWLHDYGQRRIRNNGRLDGKYYYYKGTVMNKNRFVMGLGVTASLGTSTSLFARYDGEFNRRYNAQTFQFGFGFGY